MMLPWLARIELTTLSHTSVTPQEHTPIWWIQVQELLSRTWALQVETLKLETLVQHQQDSPLLQQC